MADTKIYLKAEQNAEVMEPQVCVKDIASVYCADQTVLAKAKSLRVHQFHEKEQKRQVVSILYVIELLEKECGREVVSLGENAVLIAYSLGLAVGIILFFNHVGGRRITKDPTPIEVEMRVYETDVNKALIETADREGKSIDVS